jgi:hypothetical protein
MRWACSLGLALPAMSVREPWDTVSDARLDTAPSATARALFEVLRTELLDFASFQGSVVDTRAAVGRLRGPAPLVGRLP